MRYLLKKSVKVIVDDLKNQLIKTVYFTGNEKALKTFIPCKFIMDREVCNTVAEIIEISELLTRMPNRLNKDSLVVFAYDESFSKNEIKNIKLMLKEREVSVIGLCNKQLEMDDLFDYQLLYEDSNIEYSMPSAVLLLTTGILNKRESSVYPELYSGMESNIEKLKNYSDLDVSNIFNSLVNLEIETKKINIIASGTDVATQQYLSHYFNSNGLHVNKIDAGEFLRNTQTNSIREEFFILILGMDASRELDNQANDKLKSLVAKRNRKTFEIKNIDKLSMLDRPFAKVISSIIVYYAMNNQMKELQK